MHTFVCVSHTHSPNCKTEQSLLKKAGVKGPRCEVPGEKCGFEPAHLRLEKGGTGQAGKSDWAQTLPVSPTPEAP